MSPRPVTSAQPMRSLQPIEPSHTMGWPQPIGPLLPIRSGVARMPDTAAVALLNLPNSCRALGESSCQSRVVVQIDIARLKAQVQKRSKHPRIVSRGEAPISKCKAYESHSDRPVSRRKFATWPSVAERGPCKFLECRPSLAQTSNRPGLGQSWPGIDLIGKLRPRLANVGPESAKLGPESNAFGLRSTKLFVPF